MSNLSMVCMTSSGMLLGAEDSLSSASECSGKTVQFVQAVLYIYIYNKKINKKTAIVKNIKIKYIVN